MLGDLSMSQATSNVAELHLVSPMRLLRRANYEIVLTAAALAAMSLPLFPFSCWRNLPSRWWQQGELVLLSAHRMADSHTC
jgi:hypothetical protein